jgi:hypothetical protein
MIKSKVGFGVSTEKTIKGIKQWNRRTLGSFLVLLIYVSYNKVASDPRLLLR